MRHKKINKEFYDLLVSHPAFKSVPKAIYPSFVFLQRVSFYNNRNEELLSEYYSRNISDIFKSVKEYKLYLNALVELKLLIVNEKFILPSKDNTGNSLNDGHCKSYHTTELANDLLYSLNLEYLDKLHNDKKLIRQTQQNISYRKVLSKKYDDYVLNYIHDGIINMTYDYKEVLSLIVNSDKSTVEKNHIIDTLIKFKEKDFNSLHNNKSDNRIWNEFVELCSDYRKYFKYKNMSIKAIIDIRACWPTFWSSYILSVYNKGGNIPKEVHSIPSILHDVPPFHDTHPPSPDSIGSNMCGCTEIKVDIKTLNDEHIRWLELFENEAIDPRDIIAEECGYKSKDEAKEALNQSLNGSIKWPELINWLKTSFPVLFAVWNTTKKKETGINISKDYETVLMQNWRLYKIADELNIKLTYEYDGFSVYSEESINLLGKVDFIIKYLKSECQKKFGISLVIKKKTVEDNGFLEVSKLHHFTKKKEKMEKQLQIAKINYIKLLRRTKGFSVGNNKEIVQCRQSKNKYLRIKNNLNAFILDFYDDNPDIIC